MADAVCEIADAARQAFVKAGFDPGEWDSDNIVQDVKNGLVSAIETLAARSAIAPQEWIDIKDRLPEEFTEVLLMHLIDDHAKTIDIAWQSKGEWSFPWLSRLRKVDCAPVWPLRWMPLPAVDRTGA
jgi:hypothetical protein